MVSEEEVKQQLKEVVDPELDVNIVDLGLLREIEIEDEEVYVLMTLTTPGCPLHSVFDEMVSEKVKELEGVEKVDVELTFDPRWSPEDMTEEGKDEVGNIPGFHAF
ncbi:MAG: metal-sulfur cluster assembly factor [Candidatus Nanohaloarchaea archaeon]